MKKITVIAVAAALLVSGTSAFAAPQKGALSDNAPKTQTVQKAPAREAKAEKTEKAERPEKTEKTDKKSAAIHPDRKNHPTHSSADFFLI